MDELCLKKEMNQVLEVPLYMHGIEAWLVNIEDYQTLLEVMQSFPMNSKTSWLLRPNPLHMAPMGVEST